MKVIVYGTLKSGYGNNRLLSESTYVKDDFVEGYKLYHSGFPVARPDESSRIVVEVWDIGDCQRTLRNLDSLESEGVMYHRVFLPEHDAYMYVGMEEFWKSDDRKLPECPVVELDGNKATYEWSGRL